MAWVHDRVIPRESASVSIDDFSTRYGAACFETMLARNGRVFRLDAHLDRLHAGLAEMGVQPPERWRVDEAITVTLDANRLRDASLRLVVTAGSGRSPNLEAAHGPLMTLTADPLPVAPSPPRLRVVSVRLDERRPLLGAKTANFLTYLLARREARLAGADDALLLNHAGDVAEAGTSNLLALIDGTLITPPSESGAIAGITRAALIEIARGIALSTAERRISLADLSRADAVLLTSSIAGIVLAASITGFPPASPIEVDWRASVAEPTPVVRLREAYQALVDLECAVAGAPGGA